MRIKIILLATALAGSLAVQAQTTDSTAAKPPSTPGSTPAPTAIALAAAANADSAPTVLSRFGVLLVSQTTWYQEDFDHNGNKAGAETEGSIGPNYQFYKDKEKTWKVEYDYNFGYANNRELLPSMDQDHYPNAFNQRDWDVQFIRNGGALWKSDPIYQSVRYYVPSTSSSSGSNGTFRYDTFINWTLSPHVAINYQGEFRLYLKNDNNDAILRFVNAPGISWVFNDNYSIYFSPQLDSRSTQLYRSRLAFDAFNGYTSEFGANLVYFKGKLIINPALDYNTNLSDASDLGGPQYNLYLIASF